MLTTRQIERIASLWVPDEWPDFADRDYAAACHRKPFAYYVERVRHLGLAGGLLIDAGCGTGRWSFALATAFERVLGFDFTPRRLAAALWLKARFEVPCVEFVAGDIRQIPAENACADAVYSNSVVVGGMAIGAIFAECFRVLKPGGACYIGLNGPAYAYDMAKSADPALADLGRRRIYHSIADRALAPLVAELGPGGPLNAEVRERLAHDPSPMDVLAGLKVGAGQIGATRAIANDLGPEFVHTLKADLAAIAEGRRTDFSHWQAGRDYEPDELLSAARRVGFGRFEWAPDGWLSLRPDGAVRKAPCPGAQATRPEFEGRLRVFEALMWKPKTVGSDP